MYVSEKTIILASNSPRRKQFLTDCGLAFSVKGAEIDESPLPDEKPGDYVQRMALSKGRKVAENNPKALIIAADTIVVCDNKILGKPVDEYDAVKMLERLSGCSHQVMTAFYVGNRSESVEEVEVVSTEVYFADLSAATIASYVATGEPMDKAGSYGIQGVGGQLVTKISGSYTNVVGLPMAELLAVLRQYSVICR